jgi:PAS domain S-box-containing protein
MSPHPTITGPFDASPWSGRDTLISAQFASLWEAPIGLAFLDEHLRYMRVNKTLAALNGLPPEAHLGKSVAEVLPALSPEVLQQIQRVLATGQPVIDALLTGRTRATGDQDHHYLASYYPVRDEAGTLVGLGAAVHDVTGWRTAELALHLTQKERERLLEELRRAMRARDEFLTVAAHELRTPLTTLGLRLQTLWREARDEASSRFAQRVLEQAEAMRRQVKRLTDLVNGLMEVTRLGEGELPLELEWEHVELCTLVGRVAQGLAPEAARAGCALTLETECEVPGTWDRARLEQVLIHLLSNAIKYGAGRPVRVHVSRVGDRARLTVRDEGIGIAPEHLTRIFGRFERAVSERHYGGLGLGLYMTRRLVEALGGTVHVESTPGAGTTFTVELPLRPPAVGSRP